MSRTFKFCFSSWTSLKTSPDEHRFYDDYTGTGLKINKGKISYKGLARIVVSENVKKVINSTRKGVKKLKEEGYDIILIPPVLD